MLRFASVVATVMAFAVAVGSFVSTASAEEAASSSSSESCTRPADPPTPDSPVDMPDYQADAEQPNPQQEAAMSAWRDYHQSVFDSLSRSGDPRDWALATLTMAVRFVANKQPQDQDRVTALLERAIRVAPDDSLILWIAADANPAADHLALSKSAAQRLQHLEPQNAAVWLDDLNSAVQRKDERAIDAALARLAATTRFDTHTVELMKALVDVYQRYPSPDFNAALEGAASQEIPAELMPYAIAMSVTAMAGPPPVHQIINACRAKPGQTSVRAGDCASIGHVMIGHGDTMLANKLGYSVLRVSNTYTDEDVSSARNDDWAQEKVFERMLGKADPTSAQAILAFQRDWISTGSELEAMRLQLDRIDLPRTPPSDWADASSPFSSERLRKDAEWAEKAEAAPK